MTPVNAGASGVAGGPAGFSRGDGLGEAAAPGTDMSETFATTWNTMPSPWGPMLEAGTDTVTAVTTNTPYCDGSIESMPAAASTWTDWNVFVEGVGPFSVSAILHPVDSRMRYPPTKNVSHPLSDHGQPVAPNTGREDDAGVIWPRRSSAPGPRYRKTKMPGILAGVGPPPKTHTSVCMPRTAPIVE